MASLRPFIALAEDAILRRKIPTSGEMLPAVGLGTYDTLANNSAEARSAIAGVVKAMIAANASIVDTASSYNAAEAVIGDVVAFDHLRDKLFIATKMEATQHAAGLTELQHSLQQLKVSRVDLVQLHNVADPKQSLAMFRDYKAQGLCRYFGVTSTRPRDYPAMEEVMRREKPEFMEIGYSIGDRQAEERLLPAAADTGTAVLAAQPVGGAKHPCFGRFRGRTCQGSQRTSAPRRGRSSSSNMCSAILRLPRRSRAPRVPRTWRTTSARCAGVCQMRASGR